MLTPAEKYKIVGSYAIILPRNSNQALGIARFAKSFIDEDYKEGPSPAVLHRTKLFHTDSVICGLSALALRTNAPSILRKEAITDYARKDGATCFGSDVFVSPEKAVVANCSAVREWDSNGTVFGFNKLLGKGHQAGEFGHNDFYPVVIAACQMMGYDGKKAIRAMVLSDEIRGRLAEVFSLKSYKIDHVVHGAIASAATYGALLGLSAEQIESAIGLVVAHYIPWRAIRAGKQLSDSKGASAAISTEMAVVSVHRAMMGFIGPRDIFRNPEAIFRYFEPTASDDESPFDLALSQAGDDFAIMGMHFKLGLYEHQSAGALHGLIQLIKKNPSMPNEKISKIKITAYQPAFGIIGDPAKRNPKTRQSADHSMVFIVSRLLLKAQEYGFDKLNGKSMDELWKMLLLTPFDYSMEALADEKTKSLMDKIEFIHGGKEYDEKYPEGIPTSITIELANGISFDSGFVMFPAGHARNTTEDLEGILKNKFEVLGSIGVGKENVDKLVRSLSNLEKMTPAEIKSIYNFPINYQEAIDDVSYPNKTVAGKRARPTS